MTIVNGRDDHSVAVTGLACRLPSDADNVENFWEFVCKGRSAYSEDPKRFNPDAFHHAGKKSNTIVPRGAHFMKQNIAAFDANFFNISKAEAESIDPQQRIIMEVAYEAMESAGLPIHKIAGTRTGVFMGSFTSDYRELLYRDPEHAPMYTATGASNCSTSNRISWFFDLKGPSFTLNTACSSSLVAIHLAAQSLRAGECDICIVGGTSLLINPDQFMYLSNQGFLAKDGKCKSFDESGDGYGRGDGFAVVILKRVDDAVAEGDPIRAVIRGTGSNQDGKTKGFTLPSADAQESLIRETYANAGLDFKDTHYIEAHGTGTKAGDTGETEAISRTIGAVHSPSNKLVIGSVKSNIGHLEAAAGIAALVKSILMLENGMIPPSINYRKGNPGIKFDEWNLKVPTKLMSWPTKDLRRLSISAFGYGGANAHAIVDDAYHYLKARKLRGIHYTKAPDAVAHRGSKAKSAVNGKYSRSEKKLFMFSAEDKGGLKRLKASLSTFLKKKSLEAKLDEPTCLRHLAYTLNEKRSQLQWKFPAVASSLKQLQEILDQEDSDALAARSARQPRLGFLFTGQGAQWARMGIELMEYKIFRTSVEAASHYLRAEEGCSWFALEELERDESTSKLHLAEYSQTICTVLQVALVDLLRSWNLSPVAVAGHSSGEISAAYCIGALSREDAWKIAYHRGILSTQMKTIAPELKGAMMAVGASPSKAEEWISKVTQGEVVVACVNSPSSVTVSGDEAGIDELLVLLESERIFARKLKIDTAYHSPHMSMVAGPYLEALAGLQTLTTDGTQVMHSSVVGSAIDPHELGAMNWVRNLVSPVQFAEAVYDMVRPMQDGERSQENAVDILVEVGPHSALQGPANQTLKAHGITGVEYLSVLARNRNDIESALACAGSLVVKGAVVGLTAANNDAQYLADGALQPLVDLPSYSWNHSTEYWSESRISKEYRLREFPRQSLVGAPCPAFGEGERLWRGFIKLSEEPWIRDHKIQTSYLYPGAGFIAMTIEAAAQMAAGEREVEEFRLRDVQLRAALVMNEDEDVECILQIRPHMMSTRDKSSAWLHWSITTSSDGQSLRENCSGLLLIDYKLNTSSGVDSERDLEREEYVRTYHEAEKSCQTPSAPSEFYKTLASGGLNYGPIFANLTEINSRDGQSFCSLNIPDLGAKSQDRPHVIHPGTLDAVIHLVFAAKKFEGAMVPKSIDEVIVSNSIPYKAGSRITGYSNATKHGLKEMMTDIVMLDDRVDRPVVQIKGLCLADISGVSNTSDDDDKLNSKKLCSKSTWQPAIEYLSPKEQEAIVNESHAAQHDDTLQPLRLDESLLKKDDGREIYESLGISIILSKLNQYLKLLVHDNPSLSILEASMKQTSTTSMPIFSSLEGINDLLDTSEYTFASSDAAASKQASESLSAWGDRVQFKALDIEQDPNTQELKDAKFDVIVAPMVGFAKDPSTVLQGLKKLLKPEGKICVVEVVNSELRASLLENGRNHSKSSINGLDGYKDLLRRSGLDTKLVFNDSKDLQSQRFGLIVAAAPPLPNGVGAGSEIVLVSASNPSKSSKALASQITHSLEAASFRTSQFTWGNDVSVLQDKACIVLAELESSLLFDLGKQDFTLMKQLVLEAKSLLWVNALDGPEGSIATGMARSVRNEVPGMVFRTVQLDSKALSSPEVYGSLVAKLCKHVTADQELKIEAGVIKTVRLEEAVDLNEEIGRLLPQSSQKIDMMPLGEAPGPQKLAIRNPGMLDTVCFDADDVPDSELGEGQIEIQVKASGINFRDVMVAMGQIPDSLLGFEAAGIVRRVGSSVTKFKVGDRAIMFAHGAHRTIHRTRADYCEPIPQGLSFEEAATLPLVHCTAYYGLVMTAHVRAGQSILIHAAAGGVGQAAIQLANHFGLEVFATVGSDEKRKLIQDAYGVPGDHIFNSRDLSFVKGIKRMTNGRGVDVILNSLSGEPLRQTWHCIAPFGTFLEIGIKDILANTGLDMRPFLQDATFSFFNLNHIANDNPRLMVELIQGTFNLLRQGITKPVAPLSIYPVSQVENAFRLMQTGKHKGKIALSYSDDDIVPVIRSGNTSLSLDPNATYLLVGGLGGLGRSLSTMLVDNGARNLCFLSRSGAKSQDAQKLLSDLAERDVRTKAYACDVSDAKAVAKAIAQCSSDLSPVRGVVQCAMLLRDTLFDKMTHDQWTESLRPKVQGTWNLHNNLQDVDFFVILSSFAGIFGNRGQSNYAAAGAYEDAVAHHRQALGLNAVTIDLGIMREIGVLAEKGMTDNLKEWEEPFGILPAEFHALMKRAIAGQLAGPGQITPQIMTGFATGGTAAAAGISAPFYFDDPMFARLAQSGAREHQGAAGQAKAVAVHAQVAEAQTLAEAAGYVMDALVARVAKSLQTSPSEINTERPLHSYGIDSLVAVEIGNWAFKEIKSNITVIDVLSAVPIRALATKIALKSSSLPKALAKD